ncbi:NAD kinase [Ligilactobacillus ceti]|uniref:NAD kinase n=1 Tax=Ligilactobacillus ceti DSM 22408 TaxID=1122146 RepID=A0A0R2KI70_9LACO|nr:NAD kinase [Ligilactobacillus ceti]KRN89072.1 inorganic polyphosphate ATP-NAD kinase [Ligilactobacillus ceti DSM 22408]
MKFAIVANDLPKSQNVKRNLEKKLLECHMVEDEKHPEIVITIGGDGTLLSAFHKYQDQLESIRFVGVHTGHLGFYTDWREDEIDDLVVSLQSDNGQSISYPLLEVQVKYANEPHMKKYIALNEAALKKIGTTLVTDVYIGGEFFESFRGDGLCVSTPTGSTAYNKSLGGAVVHPNLEVMQVAEIGSINNRVFRTVSAPMIIAPRDWVTLYPDHGTDFVLTIDALTKSGCKIEKIMFKIAKQRIYFAKYRHQHFWRRVQDAFIGDANGV